MKTNKTLFGIIVGFGVFVHTFCMPSEAVAQQEVTATAVAIIENGSVKEIKITDAGRKNFWPPEVFITGGGGTGAVASAECVPSGLVAEIDVVNGGIGYTSAPQIRIESPADTSARIKAQMAEADNKQAIQSQKASHEKFMANLSKIGWLAIPTTVIVALLLRLKKINKTNTGKNHWVIIGGAVVVCFLVAVFVVPIIAGKMAVPHPTSGRSDSSTAVTESDVIGRWVGEYQGLASMDITLMSDGSFISSAGDFAGGRHSSGKWHISNGNTLAVDYGDGGENLLFTYKNDELVAMNGRTLHRK